MSDHLVESRHQTITATTDALTGSITPAIISTETVTINPDTGTKNYTIVNGMVRTVDGRLTKPDATTVCRACGAIVSAAASKACTDCTVTLCATCAGDPARCNHCRWWDRVRRTWAWLTTR